jgi:transmembrane sensor
VKIVRPADDAAADSQASEWVVRMRDGGLDGNEQAAFETWLGADATHAARYASFLELWDGIPSLARLGGLAPLAANADEHAEHSSSAGFRWLGRSAAAVVALVAIGGIGLAIHVARDEDAVTVEVATDVGQIKTVALADGSQITVGPRSRLTVRYSRAARQARLDEGEAFFDIAHDPAKPFVVRSGASSVRVLGTRFDVNHSGASLRLGVLEGVVTLDPGTSSASRVKAGNRAEVVERVHGTPQVSISSMAAQGAGWEAMIGTWRQGRFVYNDVRLGDVAADLNRFYRAGVRIDDGAVGDLRISAAFRAGDIPDFLETLGKVVPVTVDRDENGTFRLSKRSQAPLEKVPASQ